MGIQKNFVVKNGIEVNENLIFADKNTNKVGIGTTVTSTSQKLQVNGGIGATSIVLTGVGTIPTIYSDNLYSNIGIVTTLSGTTLSYTSANINSGIITNASGTNLNYSGIATVGSLSIGSTQVISSGRELQNIVSLDATTTATIEAAIASGPNTFTDLVVTGVSTLGVTGITTLNVTGIATFSNVDINGGDIEVSNVDTTDLNVTGIATFSNVDINGGDIEVSNVDTTDLYVSGISTLGTVLVSSGIITAASGIVTYYGDGTNLSLAGNPDLVAATGIGIGTTGGLVGYGITFLDLKGAGVSTTFYDNSVGIATIFFEGGGGGGGGAIGIGSTFPGTPLSVLPAPANGDLFFHIDYGRTFIYYDEVILGVGSSAFWVDSSPFNIGIITAIYGGVAFSDGTAGTPSWYFEDDVTTGVFSPVNGELTFVSTGSSVLNINSSGVIVTGVTTSTKANIGAATTFPEDLVVQGDARVTGILTVGTSSIILDGTTDIITVGSGATINGSNGNVVFAGSITASSFSGDGSGLTGAGSTVADDTSTNSTFYPVFTETTSGTITASKVSTTKLTFNPSTGTLTATDLNSSSDISLKENVQTVENAVETVNSLRGVKFDWKEDGRTSYGVIAQELEEVLPELVSSGDLKTVNYNGLIGVLIQAVKELSAEVEDLKNKLS